MNLKEIEGLQKDIFYLGICLLVGVSAAAVSNYHTPDDPIRVGYTEITTNCVGLDFGICMGIERQSHQTFNYDNYETVEEGEANYYRRVESELMMQASNICDNDTEGKEWLGEAEYDNKTGEEWIENDNVTLLSCSEVFHHDIR